MNYSEEKTISVNGNYVKAYKVNHDVNGNPRWVVHFLDLLSKEEQAEISKETQAMRKLYPNEWICNTSRMFDAALHKAKQFGGSKYRAKWFGGGIVFQSYNIQDELTNACATL